MSTQELQQIEQQLLELDSQEFESFISQLVAKKTQIKTANSIPVRKATPEEAKAIEEGLTSGLASEKEIEELENFLQISLR